MNTNTLTLNFHGTDLFIIDQDGQPFTPMKTIVEGMGLGWQAQYDKLTANAERWGIRKVLIPTIGSMQEAICLPLRKLSGWLATIHPNKVKTELRDTIIQYQDECDDVLWEYWTSKHQPQYGLKESPTLPAPRAKIYVKGGLELHQQDAINDFIKERVAIVPEHKRKGITVMIYSAICIKFDVKGMTHGYKNIAPEQFDNIIQLIARLPIHDEKAMLFRKRPAAPHRQTLQVMI